MTSSARRMRCAIYTRKSTEEGLEQAFNTLDAQREACEAYILSQAGEGWVCLPERYDDGGWSGGTMDRPALVRLLEDIRQGRIDIILVYKVDRLTRSLMDFARIVEIFDAQNTSFVSVTQAFNTTSSMGRLTLNVLLSFAQFEREVTGERIRDKIAASRAKGIWMGGNLPLGYDLGDRRLVINHAEADVVRHIYERYRALGAISKLASELRDGGILSKRWLARSGRVHGGLPFSCGALSHILNNRIYLGDAVHKGRAYPGEHEAILDPEVYLEVQSMLEKRRIQKRARKSRASSLPLTGKIFDSDGLPMRVSFSYGRGKVLYRYYLSACLVPDGKTRSSGNKIGIRVAAERLEKRLTDAISAIVPQAVQACDPLEHIERVTLIEKQILLGINLDDFDGACVGAEGSDKNLILVRAMAADPRARIEGYVLWLTIDQPHLRRGRPTRSLAAGASEQEHAANLADMLRKAYRRLNEINANPSSPENHHQMRAPQGPWARQAIILGLLSPDIQKAILAGNVPGHVTAEWLMAQDWPVDWEEQWQLFGSGCH